MNIFSAANDDENFPDFSFSSIAHENILFPHNNGKQQREDMLMMLMREIANELKWKWEENLEKIIREWKFMKNTSHIAAISFRQIEEKQKRREYKMLWYRSVEFCLCYEGVN